MNVRAKALERAAKQGGYLTRTQLLELGLSPSAVNRRVSSGELRAVVPAVYQLFPSDDDYDHIRGALLALPGAVVSHQSAAHLLAFPVPPTQELTVTVPSHTTHRFPGIIVRRASDIDSSHLTTVRGLRVTNVARTVFDLAGVLEYQAFEHVAEGVIIGGRMKMRHLERMIGVLGRRGKPGTRQARDFVSLRGSVDPKSTRLERKGRSVLASAGVPPPIPQYPIPWSQSRRFDDAYPESALAIEWDSRAWHSQRETMSADRQRDRDAALNGWLLIRFTWQDVTEKPQEVASTVIALLHARGTLP